MFHGAFCNSELSYFIFYCKYNLENWKHLHKQSRGTKKFIPNAFVVLDDIDMALQANHKLNSNWGKLISNRNDFLCKTNFLL